MSGGHYDYSFHRVNDMADELERSTSTVRRAFAAHLLLVANAMHDVEWVDSGDYGPGAELEAIHAVIERRNHVDTSEPDGLTRREVLRAYGILPSAPTEGDET